MCRGWVGSTSILAANYSHADRCWPHSLMNIWFSSMKDMGNKRQFPTENLSVGIKISRPLNGLPSSARNCTWSWLVTLLEMVGRSLEEDHTGECGLRFWGVFTWNRNTKFSHVQIRINSTRSDASHSTKDCEKAAGVGKHYRVRGYRQVVFICQIKGIPMDGIHPVQRDSGRFKVTTDYGLGSD